jgi:hypothetical protein
VTQSAPLLDRTHAAILALFKREDLRLLLRTGLDVDYDSLVAEQIAFRSQVYQLLEELDGDGQAVELLACLQAARSHDPALPGLLEEARLRQAQVGSGKPILEQRRRRQFIPLQRPLRVQHFTGRAAELARLLEDLRPGSSVTLCGPGGMGKSALAAEAVWTLAPGDDAPVRFPDGIIFHSFYHQPEAGQALLPFPRTPPICYHISI